MGLLTYILVLVLLIGIVIIVWLSFSSIINPEVNGQETNATPPAVAPTISPTPTPTQTSPNFQYLPQKAYVQPYAPEVGVPSAQAPLTALPPVVAGQQQQSNSGGTDLGSLAGIIGILGAGGAYLKGHFANKQANYATGISKENIGDILHTKEVQEQLAKFSFQTNPEQANALNDMPQIKLDNLSKEKQDTADRAAAS